MDAVGCLFHAVRFLSKGVPAPGLSPVESRVARSLDMHTEAMLTGRKLLDLFGRFECSLLV